MPTPAAPPSLFTRLQLALRPPARRIGLVLLVVVLGLYLTGNRLLDSIELKTYDLRLLAHPATETATSVTIVAIDEKSLAAIGRWPWSRSVLAQLIERLDAAGARVIALDVFFSEPENRAALEQIDHLEHERRLNPATSPYRSIRQALATDTTLAETLNKSGKVVLPIAFLLSPEEARHQRRGEIAQQRTELEPYAIKIIHDTGNGRLDFAMPATYGVVTNLPELTRAARAIGQINIVPDSDGAIRWAQLIMAHDGAFFPSADLQAVRLYQGAPPLTLHTAYGIRGVQLGERWIPTNEQGRALVHYRGGARHFPFYSATDVLAGRVDSAVLRDRIVLIGPTAAGLGDVRPTPIDSLLPGVEIRANTIQNLIDGDFIQRPGWMVIFDLAIIAGFGLLLAIVLPRLRFRASAAVTVVLALGYLLVTVVMFRVEGMWLNIVYPELLLVLMFVSATLTHYLTAEREKREIKHAFQHYVPVKVVDEIMHDLNKLRLGGEKRELTVLFSDIRGFTSMAEQQPPEQLVPLLNEYLTEMTEQVFRHDGLLDKYIGDAIMAVYGAPIAYPDHARRACRTAVGMMQSLHRLHGEWRQRDLPLLDIGIGINTGPMVVGNMGSKTRFDYTVIGDAVNLGSRIESLNKQYGTHILISEFTWQQVKDEFPNTREVDRATVRGRTEPVRLYELMLPEQYPHYDWIKDYARAYELYRADQRVQARTLFKRLAEELNDPVSRYYAERC